MIKKNYISYDGIRGHVGELLGNPNKTMTFLWDQISNTSKVSFRYLENQDVHQIEIDGMTVIIIIVKEVPESKKPVFLNISFPILITF